MYRLDQLTRSSSTFMRILSNKKIEFFLKNLLLSESYLLEKRAKRFYKKKTEIEIRYLPNLADRTLASIDIGVYRGVYSYYLSKESKYVYAFEANPLLIKKLKKGFQKYKNIKIENFAISSNQGFADLKIPFRNQNINYTDHEELYQLGTATIHDKNNLADIEFDTIEIKKINLDSYSFDHTIGFIKIDVEGHEIDIINGAKKLISKDKPNLMIEIEEKHTGIPNIEIINQIKEFGYECFSLSNNLELRVVNQQNIKNISNNNFIFKK